MMKVMGIICYCLYSKEMSNQLNTDGKFWRDELASKQQMREYFLEDESVICMYSVSVYSNTWLKLYDAYHE